MKIRPALITIALFIMAFSLCQSTLAYGTDATQEDSYYCLGYANCTGYDCLYVRMAPNTDCEPFKKNEKVVTKCDALEVELAFPDSKDESFVGNLTWSCFRYYDGIGHHFAVLKITLSKPSDVSTSQVNCTSSIGDCTLVNETSSDVTFVAGLPYSCITGVEYSLLETETVLPSENQELNCFQYENCTGDLCHFNVSSSKSTTNPFNTDEGMRIPCDNLTVDIICPETKESNFSGNKTYTCFQYSNGNGKSFSVIEVILDKPKDVKGSQVSCTFNQMNCTLRNETSSQLVLVAGLPKNCAPFASSSTTSSTTSVSTTAASTTTVSTSTVSTTSGPLIFPQHEIPDLTCYSYSYCSPSLSCKLFGRPLSSEENVRHRWGVVAPSSCEPLEATVKCPEGNHSICTEVRECYIYVFDNSKGYFSVLGIRVKKPRYLKGNQVTCTTSIGYCALYSESPLEVIFIAGIPNNCIRFFTPPTAEIDLLSRLSFECRGYANCVVEDCLFQRMTPTTESQSFNKNEKSVASCDSLEVEFKFPDPEDMANDTRKCYSFYNRKGYNFSVQEIAIKRPIGVNGNQVNCTANIGKCKYFGDTFSEMYYVAGYPDSCDAVLSSSGRVKLSFMTIVLMAAFYIFCLTI